jgi:hypothetical protein
MANAAQIKKAQDRREARKNAVKGNEEAAKRQEYELAALSDKLRGVSNPDAPPVDISAHIATTQPMPADYENPSERPRKGPSSRKIAAQQAAEAQAEIDVRATVNPLDEQITHDLSYYTARGEEPPLHVLNAIAKQNDNAIKDDARIAAQAAGKAAYDALTEHRSNRSPESRYKKIEQTMKDAAAAKTAAATKE